MQLLLFDIDGTLVDTGGVGRAALQEGMRLAFPEAVGEQEIPSLNLAGATDLGITRFLFETFGVEETPESQTTFLDAYVGVLKGYLFCDDGGVKGRVLAGVPVLLEALEDRADVVLGLLTGNTLAGAQTKLDAYELSSSFCFESSAYGSDHWDRNQLGFLAMKRASDTQGRDFSPEDVTVIGDTPKDIACAKACGARVLAVATGGFDEAALSSLDPDHVVPGLGATDDVLGWLLR